MLVQMFEAVVAQKYAAAVYMRLPISRLKTGKAMGMSRIMAKAQMMN